MSQDDNRVRQEQWTDVDGTADSAQCAWYLDTVSKMDAASAYKARSIAMLRVAPGARVLDAGCGTGSDAARIAELVGSHGRVTGIDIAAALIAQARDRFVDAALPLDFEVADVHRMDFADGVFDGARSDRVFQHVESPTDALGELIRVVRPRGRVVISDPDWGTFIMDGPATRAMQSYLEHGRRQARNSKIGRQLYGMFQRAGLLEVEVAAQTLFFLDYELLERMGNLDSGFDGAIADGSLAPADVAALKQDLADRHGAGCFFSAVTVFTVAGTRP